MTKTIAKQTTLIIVIIVINAFSITSENLCGIDLAVDDKDRSTVFTSSIFLYQCALLPDYTMNHDGDLRQGVLGNTIPLAKTPPSLRFRTGRGAKAPGSACPERFLMDLNNNIEFNKS